MGSNVASVTKELKAFLSATTTGVEVLCRGLIGKGLHTWLGLIGYCLKVITWTKARYIFSTFSHHMFGAIL